MMLTTTIALLYSVSFVASQTCLDNETQATIDIIRSSLITLETHLNKQSTSCKNGWQKFNDHCYYFSSETKPWVEAEMSCRQLGGYLVQITDSTENAWIVDNAKASSQESPWLGATDFQEGTWRWVNDLTKVVYTDWQPGQPDNSGGREDCGQIYKPFNYKWNDHQCEHPFHYICESHMGNSCQTYSKIFRR